MRRIIFPFLILIFATQCARSVESRIQELPSCGSAAEPQCLQVGTLNLEWFPDGRNAEHTEYRIRYKMQKAADAILKNHLDLIAIQEIHNRELFAEWVLAYLGDQFAYTVGRSGQDLSIAILWRKSLLELKEWGEIDESGKITGFASRSRHRYPLAARFALSGSLREFWFVSVHLKSNSKTGSCQVRQQQANSLSRFALSLNSDFIIAGDYNDIWEEQGICGKAKTYGEDPLAAFETSPFAILTGDSDIFPETAVSYIKKPYRSRIDHIVTSRGIESEMQFVSGNRRAVIIEHETKKFTDHQPVIVWWKPQAVMDNGPEISKP